MPYYIVFPHWGSQHTIWQATMVKGGKVRTTNSSVLTWIQWSALSSYCETEEPDWRTISFHCPVVWIMSVLGKTVIWLCFQYKHKTGAGYGPVKNVRPHSTCLQMTPHRGSPWQFWILQPTNLTDGNKNLGYDAFMSSIQYLCTQSCIFYISASGPVKMSPV